MLKNTQLLGCGSRPNQGPPFLLAVVSRIILADISHHITVHFSIMFGQNNPAGFKPFGLSCSCTFRYHHICIPHICPTTLYSTCVPLGFGKYVPSHPPFSTSAPSRFCSYGPSHFGTCVLSYLVHNLPSYF